MVRWMSAASKCSARISLVETSRELTFSGLIGVRDSSIGNTGGHIGWFSSRVAGKLSLPVCEMGFGMSPERYHRVRDAPCPDAQVVVLGFHLDQAVEEFPGVLYQFGQYLVELWQLGPGALVFLRRGLFQHQYISSFCRVSTSPIRPIRPNWLL